MRTLVSIFICYSIYFWLHDKEWCDDPCSVQIKFFKRIFIVRQSIINHYMSLSIFFTPFVSKYFSMLILSSACFAVEMVLINKYYDSDNTTISLVYIPMWWTLMLTQTYFNRSVMTKFFVMQTEAESTRDALTQILDNLPDAVLTLEAGNLCYCNQQADSFFDVELSHVSSKEDLRAAQYLIMNQRCMHEVKSGRVAERLQEEEEDGTNSRSI